MFLVRGAHVAGILAALCAAIAGVAQDLQDSRRQYIDLGDRIIDMQGNLYRLNGDSTFCDTGSKGGGVVDSSLTGAYLALARCIDHARNPNSLPVVPCWPNQERCDSVIVLVDTHSWRILRILNETPSGRGALGYGSFWFAIEDKYFLAVNDNGTEIWVGPEFGGSPAFVAPFRMDLLGSVDGHRILARSWPTGRTQGFYFLLRQARQELEDTGIRVAPVHWGYELQADVLRQHGHEQPCPHWRSVYADDVSFVALFPKCEGFREHARVAAYRFSGGAPAVITLPDGYEDLHVERLSGALRCSWSVGGERTTREFVFPDTSFPDLDWWYEPYPEPTYWLDERGVLTRLADGAVCDYAIKPDGTRYDFLPYGRKMHLWASPDGRYVVVKGALNPKDNPNPGPCDRPGFFRKGYDSVLMVVDTQSCRPVRIFNVTGDTRDVTARFTADGELLLVSGIDRGTTVLKLPSFSRIGVLESGPNLHLLSPVPQLRITGRPDGKKSWYGWWTGDLPVVVAVEGDRIAEVPQAAKAWEALQDRFGYQTDAPYWVRPQYIDDQVAVFAGIREVDPEAPVLLATAAYASGAPKLEAEFVKGARDVTIRRRPDGSVVCDYATAKGRAEKLLWKPPEKAEHGQEPQAPGH